MHSSHFPGLVANSKARPEAAKVHPEVVNTSRHEVIEAHL